ncbi:MAG: response regulator transcription factor [Ignavibacteriae bacterium]|nr:response regulator transcription factor [Ignavibacteriota bacterium]
MITRNLSTEQLDLWVVDDNVAFAKNLAELINQTEGLQCGGIFHSCEEVLHDLEAESPPDVILMDIGFPGMNGIEGVKRVKMVAPAVQVIMLTVFEDNDNIFRAITAGASGYLHKSATLDEIINALKAILVGGVPMNPHIARKMLEIFKHLSTTTSDYGITAREKEVLQLLVDGLSKKQIADKLFVSFHTIDTHLRNIYAKLQVNSRSGAIVKVLKEHLL